MGKVGYAAGVYGGHAAEVEKLHQEPEPDQQSGGDECDPNEDQEEHHSLDAIAGVGDEECSHDGRDGATGAQTRNACQRIAKDLAQHGDDSAS